MKNVLVMGLSAVGLFIATVVGLLAAQGRLTHEGTKGIPVLHSFFPAETGEGEKGVAGAPGGEHQHAGGQGVDLTKFEEPGVAERVQGPSVSPDQPGEPIDRSATGGDAQHGETQGGQAKDVHDGHAPHATGGPHGHQPTAHGTGDKSYSPGRLFDFPVMESGLSVAEINSYVKEIEAERRRLAQDRATLETERRELVARETDIRDREDNVRELMKKITQEREALLAEIRAYEARAVLVRTAEESKHLRYAESLAAMDATRAGRILLQMWNSADEPEKDKAIKILAVMKKTASGEILATLGEEHVKPILDRLSTVVRESESK